MIQWIISKPLKALAAIKRAIALMLLGWSEKNSHQVPQLRIDSTMLADSCNADIVRAYRGFFRFYCNAYMSSWVEFALS